MENNSAKKKSTISISSLIGFTSHLLDGISAWIVAKILADAVTNIILKAIIFTVFRLDAILAFVCAISTIILDVAKAYGFELYKH